MNFSSESAGMPPCRPSLKRVYPFDTDEYIDTQHPQPNSPFIDQHNAPALDNEEICFGSIIDVKVLPHNVDGLKQFDVCSGDIIQPFAVVQEGDFLTLEHRGVKFGRLNKGLCRHLHDLVSQNRVRIQVFIPGKELAKATRSGSSHPAELLPAEINIYGTKMNARWIGDTLSKSGIFLQSPQHGPKGVDYYNPHILRMEGYSDLPSLEPSQESTDNALETPDRGVRGSAPGNDSEMVDSILDSLSHRHIIKETTIVPNIKSALLTHQQEAIDFIRQREADQIDSDLSLWKYNDVDADEPFYQHVLSGAKRPERAETRGGIIADEMGLGKSLVIISTIADSLDRAETFVKDDNEQRLSRKERKVASSATLVIVPSSLLIDNWVDGIRKHTYPSALAFHKHIGSERHKEEHHLHDRPIVFTTYATIASEFRRGDSTLKSIYWFRIVLDEAHDIRNRSTRQFQAVASIPALHRWCLTGTPIQNSLDDLGALISFLKVPILEKAPTFRKLITIPIESESRSRFRNLQLLLRTICLRRTRQLLDLPEPVAKIRRLSLNAKEQCEYQELLAQGRTEIDMAVSRRGKGNVNSAFLESLLKLRLFCNNGRANAIIKSGPTGLPKDPDEALIYLQQHEQNVCAYCSGTVYFINGESVNDGGMFIPGCSHLLCHSCVPYHRAEKQGCPACTKQDDPLTTLQSGDMHIESLQSHANNNMGRAVPYPSKLMALLADIRENFSHKSIVFSSWKKTLDLVSQLLSRHGIPHRIIDGSLPLSERLKVLKDFRSPDGVNILLMTLGTGAVGLNLAVASRIHLLEPQWNPSIESQAIGRALRLGQTAQVVIVRYIMIGTIEENNVFFTQERKRELAGSGFNKGKDMQSNKIQALKDVFGVDKNLVVG